jgi:hypothetical protein
MCDACRSDLRRAYRGNPETMGRVPPWEEDCGYEFCTSCGQRFHPDDDNQRLCIECRLSEDEDEGDGKDGDE